eukprot:5232316-Pyramimonas_sp.AAC.1
MVLIDANARVGSVISSVVGDKGFVQDQDSNGDDLHELASAASLHIVNTLLPDPESGHTFVEHG